MAEAMVENGDMIVAAAFCPMPPLLHPQAMGPAGAELGNPLRSACAGALDRALAQEPDSVLVLGTGCADAVFEPREAGDLCGYGVPVRVGFDGPPDHQRIHTPLPHTLGSWLLDEAGFTGKRVGLTAGSAAPDWSLGRWAVLVMGDGSARRTESSPGWYDPDAIPFDDSVLAALASGDAAGLRDLDEGVGERVMAAGTAAWRSAGALLAGLSMSPTLHFADDPFGVYYLVASWVAPP